MYGQRGEMKRPLLKEYITHTLQKIYDTHRYFSDPLNQQIKKKVPVLQIRGGTEDNSKIFFSYFSMKTYVVTSHKNCLIKTVLMMGHKICLCNYP